MKRESRPAGGGGRRASAARAAAAPGEGDAELVAACIAGDRAAFAVLVGRYKGLVYSVPMAMGLHRPEADDVFQDTFVALLENLASLRNRGRLGIWLAVTARRKALDRLTRGAGRFETGIPDHLQVASGEDLPLDALLRLERQNWIRHALDRLGGPCRALLGGLFFTDPPVPYQEIARRLGIRVGSIGPTRRRCLEKLHAELVKLRDRGRY